MAATRIEKTVTVRAGQDVQAAAVQALDDVLFQVPAGSAVEVRIVAVVTAPKK